MSRPVAGVDIPVARAILEYNMKRLVPYTSARENQELVVERSGADIRYPDGVFFLYFQARLHTSQCEPELANSTSHLLDHDEMC
jgi:hypothetical protein